VIAESGGLPILRVTYTYFGLDQRLAETMMAATIHEITRKNPKTDFDIDLTGKVEGA